MKQTFYIIKNTSKSEGTYFIDGEYKPLYPGEKLTLNKEPVSYTANIKLTLFRKEIGEPEILNKKPIKIKK